MADMNLIFEDPQYNELKTCESIADVQKFATTMVEGGATLDLQIGETVSISDNSQWDLPTDKKIVQFFLDDYVYILLEDGRIYAVKRHHPSTEVTVWKSIAESVEKLADVKDFSLFRPKACWDRVAPCIIAVHENGTTSVIEGKQSAKQAGKILEEISGAQNVEYVFGFTDNLVVLHKDGTIQTLGVKKDMLAKYTFQNVKSLTADTYVIVTDDAYVLVDGKYGVVHDFKNTIKVVYSSYSLYYLTDKRFFSEPFWSKDDDLTKTFNPKVTITDFWIQKAFADSPEIVVLYQDGTAITYRTGTFNVINNIADATYDKGKLYLHMSGDTENASIEKKAAFSIENIKKQSLQTLEQIYRRLGQQSCYYQGTAGLFGAKISDQDYELLEQDALFKEYKEKATGYASDVLSQWSSKNSDRVASFENASIFLWEDIVSVVELAHFINAYKAPSFQVEMYFSDSEYTKPFCFTLTNKDEHFIIKTKRKHERV